MVRVSVAVLLLLALVVSGCNGAPGGGGRIEIGITVHEDYPVEFFLTVTNRGSTVREFQFASSQEFDFVVSGQGRTVWRWSDDQMFAQVITETTLAPGQSVTYRATWDDPAPGSYSVAGHVLDSRGRLSATASFTVGDR